MSEMIRKSFSCHCPIPRSDSNSRMKKILAPGIAYLFSETEWSRKSRTPSELLLVTDVILDNANELSENISVEEIAGRSLGGGLLERLFTKDEIETAKRLCSQVTIIGGDTFERESN